MVRAFISLSEKLFRYILIFCNKSNLDYTQNAKSNFRFTLHLPHQNKTRRTFRFVFFIFFFWCPCTHIDPSPNLLANLDWVRISDESRCQLASIRLGRNSSVRSLPIKYGAPQIFDSSLLSEICDACAKIDSGGR